MNQTRDNLFLLGSTHRSAPLEIREKITVGEEKMASLYSGLNEIETLKECLVLNTCNRIELYAVSHDDEIKNALEHYFCKFHDFDRELFKKYSFWKVNHDVVNHLFEVSSGIDSQIVGETEITGQVKSSYQSAVEKSTVGPVLHRLFQKSFQAAKWVRSNSAIGRGQISIGNVAVDLALRIFGDLNLSRILVIGTGEVGEKTLKALKSRGARSIAISSRTHDNAVALANAIGGQAILFEEYPETLTSFDIIICSTASTEPIISFSTIESAIRERPDRPMFLIDLAMPRDIDTRVANIPNVFLYNLDDLSEIANENIKSRTAEIDRCRQYLHEKSKSL